MIPFSVLDLSPITEGSDAARSFRNTLDLAQHAERWGFNRYWLAEHHGMPGIASAATSVLIGHVAGGTTHHPRGRRRHHAAQPFAAGDRRAVRHARVALPRPHRPGPGPRAGLRPGDGAGAAPQPHVGRRRVPARRGRTHGPDVRPAEAGDPRRARHGPEGAGMDPGLQPVRRPAGGDAGPALRLCVAFRAAADDAGDRRSIARISSRRRSWPSPM